MHTIIPSVVVSHIIQVYIYLSVCCRIDEMENQPREIQQQRLLPGVK